MSATAAKAEKSLAATCAAIGITESGKRWLDLVLDPFKDLNMPTAGYPDSVTIPSVVQTIHDSYNISVPVSAGAGTWDANVFIDQAYNAVLLKSTAVNMAQGLAPLSGQSGTEYSRGGLVVRSGPAGTQLGMTSTTFTASLKQDVLTHGDVRVVGIGMEIHNTTSELNKQGALVTYRVPDAPVKDFVMNNVLDTTYNVACIPNANTTVLLVEVPQTQSEAIDMPGSLQWEAKDGAYVVPIFSSPTNYPQSPELIALLENDELNGYFYPALLTGGTANKISYVRNNTNMLHGFCPAGVYLSGLSNSTTLTVNLTYYVEVFPTKDSVLRRSVQPAPGLDAKALDLYAHIVAHMPTGVEVSENGWGTFISGIASVARTVGGAIMRYGPTALRAVEGVSNILGGGISANGSPSFTGLQDSGYSGGGTLSTRGAINNYERAIVPFVPREEILTRRNGPVVSDRIQPSGREVITQVRPGGIVTRTELPRRSVTVNNDVMRVRGEKAKKKKNKMISNAAAGYAGNRWVGK